MTKEERDNVIQRELKIITALDAIENATREIRTQLMYLTDEVCKATRKDEPSSSEKPNNSTISKMEQVETMSCQECKHFHENAVMYLDQCDFCFKDCKYEPKDEPQTDCA